MKIDRVYINTHRYDKELTGTCVASVRYWYPDIAISLIFDYSNGRYNYTALCRRWNVDVLDTQGRKYGWGLGKFEPLFLGNKERFLVLDADTVLCGPVLDSIDALDADFVVDRETQPPEDLKILYYDPEKLKDLYPDFVYPGYTFNTGQWIGRGGILRHADFDAFVNWKPVPRLKYPDIFKQADQGVLNLVVHQKEAEGKLSVEKIPLMIWPANGAGDFIRLDAIKDKKPDFPFVIHWAGMKFRRLNEYPLSAILLFYRQYYYSGDHGLRKLTDRAVIQYLSWEKKARLRFKKLIKSRS